MKIRIKTRAVQAVRTRAMVEQEPRWKYPTPIRHPCDTLWLRLIREFNEKAMELENMEDQTLNSNPNPNPNSVVDIIFA